MKLVFPPFIYVGHFLLGDFLRPLSVVLGARVPGIVVVPNEVDKAAVRHGIGDHMLLECR